MVGFSLVQIVYKICFQQTTVLTISLSLFEFFFLYILKLRKSFSSMKKFKSCLLKREECEITEN